MTLSAITPSRLKAGLRQWLNFGQTAASTADMQETFRRIWAENYWGDAESRSGGGSNLEQTRALRAALAELLVRWKIHSVLDVPCGDYHWMKEVLRPSGMQYIGADIVAELVASNQERYGNEQVKFRRINLVEDQLPQVDLVFCRDCLVHLSYDAIGKALGQIRASRSTYLLMTHFPAGRRNRDIATGQWRPLDWRRKPFHFPEPLAIIEENCTEDRGRYRDKAMALWRVNDIPKGPFTR